MSVAPPSPSAHPPASPSASLASPARALPRGPHQLSRAEVEESQRQRLLLAMGEVVGEQGYVATSVADVLRRAGVSRATFYAQFHDKQDCFLALQRAGVELVTAVMQAELDRLAAEPDVEPRTKLARVLAVYLASIQGSPGLSRTFLVEVYAAGPEAVAVRRRSLERFVDIVAETHRGEPGLLGTDPEQRFAAEAVVAMVSSMVTNLVGVGDFAAIAELEAPLMRFARTLVGVRPGGG